MSELITLDEVKAHCRIDDNQEDALLESYIAAALEACQRHIGKRFDGNKRCGSYQEFTPALKAGCLMFIGTLYEWRETVADAHLVEVPKAISILWTAYREPGIY